MAAPGGSGAGVDSSSLLSPGNDDGGGKIIYEGPSFVIRKVLLETKLKAEDDAEEDVERAPPPQSNPSSSSGAAASAAASTTRPTSPAAAPTPKKPTLAAPEAPTYAAVKTLAHPANPLVEDVVRLNNEYNVLRKYLSSGTDGEVFPPGVRGVIRNHEFAKGSDNHGPSYLSGGGGSGSGSGVVGGGGAGGGQRKELYLEYVEGTSVGNWMEKNPLIVPSPVRDLVRRVGVARGIASALADVNDAGIVHNDVVPSSFVVSFARPVHRMKSYLRTSIGFGPDTLEFSACTVKIISLGYAAHRSSVDLGDEGERTSDDLTALGALLRKLFSDDNWDDDDDGAEGRGLEDVDMMGGTGVADADLGFGFDFGGGADEGGRTGHAHIRGSLVTLPPSLPRSLHTLVGSINEVGRGGASDFGGGGAGGMAGAPQASAQEPYGSAREVADDLSQMLDDPVAFLFDPMRGGIEREQMGKLRLSIQLYGREEEGRLLEEACRRIAADPEFGAAPTTTSGGLGLSETCNSERTLCNNEGGEEGACHDGTTGHQESVFVMGRAGTGKSSLVTHVCRSLVKSFGGYFVHAKFDEMRRGEPYSGLIVAFSDLCSMILDRGEETIRDMAFKINTALGSLRELVVDVIPNLVKIIGEFTEDESLDAAESSAKEGTKAQNRLKFVFRKFVRSISRPEHPIVLFLDDLQWADEASLDLIETLQKDGKNTNMLFVCAYRNNEVSEDHPLTKHMRTLEQNSLTRTIRRIELGDFDVHSLNCLVSNALCMFRRLTRPLASIIHSKTHGNPLFSVQFLRSLLDNDLLRFSVKSNVWHWDANEIQGLDISDNVVDLMSAKIERLPGEKRGILKLASCLGSYFSESTLQIILDKLDIAGAGENKSEQMSEMSSTLSNMDLGIVLTDLEQDGLIVQEISNAAGRSQSRLYRRYTFVHDRVQQAAYSALLKEEERAALHLELGRAMLEDARERGQMKRHLFHVVDQLNLGEAQIVREKERAELAALNLMAGELAVKKSAFVPAASYLRTSERLFGRGESRLWSRKHYDRSLRLYSTLAEAEFVNLNFTELDRCVQSILDNARTLLDKFSAYLISVEALMARGRSSEAIETGFYVLAQLGEPFPKSEPSKCSISYELIKTKYALAGKSNDKLALLPIMQDQKKIAAMRMLSIIVNCCYISKPELTPLISFRMVRISLRYGLCNESALAFATLGMVSCGMLRDMKRAFRYGDFALSILYRFHSKEWLARVYCWVYLFNLQMRDPIRSNLDKLQSAAHVGMEVGDVLQAMLSNAGYASHSFFCGRELLSLQREMEGFSQQMREYKQAVPHLVLSTYHQCVLNLMGRSGVDDPLRLSGTAMDEDDMLKEAAETGNSYVEALVHFHRLLLAYTFGQYAAAADIAERNRGLVLKGCPGQFVVVNFIFYDGLAACAAAREGGGADARGASAYRARSREARNQMKNWSAHGPLNCSHKYLLMKAEDAALRGKNESARNAFEAAIAAAKTSSFVQDEALAHERAALFYLDAEKRDGSVASQYVAKAQNLYSKWGAKAKAEQLQSMLRG